MKNNLLLIFLSLFFLNSLSADDLDIQSLNISIDKNDKTMIFTNEVSVTDVKNNKLQTEYAEYKKEDQLLKTKDQTTITTSEGYFLEGSNIIFNNNDKYIKSKSPAIITDLENNKIYLENFEYSTEKNFFKSLGSVEVIDSKNNKYNFSQVYIDEKKREILGSDSKVFMNEQSFLMSPKNKPRIFANTVQINKDTTSFSKSIFTLCDYRQDDKCPPWSLQAANMTHDKKKKTIYYDNAVIKVYDLPIFYLPKLSHPDPSVDRRSGFLPPSFLDTKNLGAGFSIPYFWDIQKDKDLTFTSKLFVNENPLFLGQYRQAFEKSNLLLDSGYTQGYKKTSKSKKKGDKSHIFGKYVKNFLSKNNSENKIEITMQEVSNDKYLKLYKIKSDLVDYQLDSLTNEIDFTHENDDFFLGVKASAYETLKDNYNDKYEYILPDVTFNKNLLTDSELGVLDFKSNLRIRNYDTNKTTRFLVNDFDWRSKDLSFNSGLRGNFIGKFKNINYEAKNSLKKNNKFRGYKENMTHELFGAFGYLTELDLYKKTNNNFNHLLTPKILFRYAPDHMRKEDNGAKVNYLNIFNLDRLNTSNNFESGMSATLGFDYEVKNSSKKLNFSAGQIINKRENKDMPSTTSLDEKLSDVMGNANLEINDRITLNYNFALDQNYKDLNYNEIGTDIKFDKFKLNFNYLEEKEHIGNQEYVKANVEFYKGKNGLLAFETKRNLITNSSEFYNLSYEYLNDCLRAGLVYRREFYNDSELEPENSLMFQITLIPFGNVNSPLVNK